MQEYICQRVLEISEFIIENNGTVREAAKKFGVSKSTVHKDVTERLPRINKELFLKVRNILDKNKAERHLRGGEATRKKYRENNAVS
jgi:putative DeoR family transcriptional regulator (stage III sporulation protein D)